MELQKIIETYISETGVTLEELTSSTQKQDIVIVRQCIWYSLRKNACTFKQIGRLFNRKHSTVINGINRINNYLYTKDRIIEPYQHLLHAF